MARRKRQKAATETYTDQDGNRLTLRRTLSSATIERINSPGSRPSDTTDDLWRRRNEMLFEHLVVRWEIAGLPLEDQALLLGRLRMASPGEQEWVRATIDEHLNLHIPEALER